jgi:hypothetical protein
LPTVDDLSSARIRLWHFFLFFASFSHHWVNLCWRTAFIQIYGIYHNTVHFAKVINNLIELTCWFIARRRLLVNLARTCIRLVNPLATSSDHLNPPATTHIWDVHNFLIFSSLGLPPFWIFIVLYSQIKVKRIITTVFILVWFWHEFVNCENFVFHLFWVIGCLRVHGVSFVFLICFYHGLAIRRHHCRLSNNGVFNTSSQCSAITILDCDLLVMNCVLITFWES